MYMLIVLNLEFMLIVFILELYICMFFSEINLQLFFLFFFLLWTAKQSLLSDSTELPKREGSQEGCFDLPLLFFINSLLA